jgi:hypothetical protein
MMGSLLAEQLSRGIQDAVLLAQHVCIRVQRVLQVGRSRLFTSDVKKNARHAYSPCRKGSGWRPTQASASRKDSVSFNVSKTKAFVYSPQNHALSMDFAMSPKYVAKPSLRRLKTEAG